MAITTKVARHYAIRMHAIAIVSVAFTLWGAYDLWIKIPRENATAERFEQIGARLAELEEGGGVITEEARQEHESLTAERQTLTGGGASPARASKFDHVVCWIFISCLPMAPYFWWKLIHVGRQVHRLEDDGTLVMPEGDWTADDIVDIDMSRWMAKSIAWVVHKDGTRVKLDDYVYRNLHLIIGAIASKRYPDQWDAEAKAVKKPAPADPEPAEVT